MSSFVADKIVMDGLTYDDVLLIPAYSEVLPKEVELKTRFSRNIELNVPFVTAAMDTVTEASMAIAIAREGGIGVIHKNMTIEEQARQVAIVKRAENGMIYDPVTIRRGSTVKDALDMMHDYHIGGIPVVDDENHLVGIVTNRDLRFERHLDKKIDEVMTSENLVTTHLQTDLIAAAQILQENKIEKLPVVDNANHLVGLITYKDITKAKDKPMACKDEKGRLRVAAGVGVTVDTLDRAKALVEAGADAIVIDTAHGHSKGVVEKLHQVKAAFPNVDVVVGKDGIKKMFEGLHGEGNLWSMFPTKILELGGYLSVPTNQEDRNNDKTIEIIRDTLNNWTDLWNWLQDSQDHDTLSIGGIHFNNLYGKALNADDVFDEGEAKTDSIGFKIEYEY